MKLVIGGEEYDVLYTDVHGEIEAALKRQSPDWMTFDTETTGLHLKKDKAFMGAVCWYRNPEKTQGVVWLFPAQLLTEISYWSKLVKNVYAHNTTFDMHMTANATNDENLPLLVKNWSDTMALCRLTFEAVSERDGGDSLSLKDVGKKYIDKNADKYEKELKSWLKHKETENFKVLVAFIQGRYGKKGWAVKRIHDIVDGKESAEPEILQLIEDWKESYPKPTYMDVPKEILWPYLAVDVILCNILVKKALPVVVYHKQESILQRENELIPVVYKMARPGIKVDMNYLRESREKLVAYIAETNQRMQELAGREFTVGQHKVIKEIYAERLGYTPESTDKQFLLKMIDKGDELAKCISKLRRLEKWLSTYIDRIWENAQYDGRFYSGCNAYNPVSGRFSGDAQQFPKEKISTEDGEEIFYPRRAFVADTGQSIYYLDYSQVELRMQGHYTLPFGGDTNLCRAYMPFKCLHYQTGEPYNHTNLQGRIRWSELKEGHPTDLHWEDQLKQGWSVWVMPETGEYWIPTDVHSATSLRALAIMGRDTATMEKAELKKWRGIGKTFNFMRNYGGGDAMAAETLQIPLEAAKAMNQGYTDAFPMVVTYQRAVESQMHKKSYVQNLYGRRYRVFDSRKFYKCGNYLIQGSCADMLKQKMIDVDRFLEDKQSKMIMCIHDELQFSVPPEEEWIIPVIKQMMESTPNVMLPIVAEVEKTTTSWAEKRSVHV